MMEKEKSIGHTYIDLANYANPTGVSERLNLTMMVAESTVPTRLRSPLPLPNFPPHKHHQGISPNMIVHYSISSFGGWMVKCPFTWARWLCTVCGHLGLWVGWTVGSVVGSVGTQRSVLWSVVGCCVWVRPPVRHTLASVLGSLGVWQAE